MTDPEAPPPPAPDAPLPDAPVTDAASAGDGPLWRRIREVLAAEIAAGRWGPGERLPSETALARRFGVNRHTLRRAMAALRDEGRLHVRRGAGATVTTPPTDYPLGRRMRFGDRLRAAGRSPGRVLLRAETAAARPEEAAALELPPGARVHLTETLRTADGAPVALARTCWPADRLPGFLDLLRETESVTEALARCGVPDYLRRWTRLRARRPGVLVARHLRIDDTVPVLLAEGLSAAPDGRPIEYGLTWFCTDRLPLIVRGAPEEDWGT